MQSDSNVTSQKKLTIGGIQILLRSSHSAFWQSADKRYQNFYTTEEASPEETIDLQMVSKSDVPVEKRGNSSIWESNGTVRMIRGTAVAQWNRRQHTAWIKQPKRDFLPPTQYPEAGCDSLLRIMLSYRLLEKNGVLLHGAGLIRNRQGYLFIGQSGAGKSTVARLSAKTSTVLSDDLTLVYLTPEGGQIFGTPFFGEFATAGANLSAPLVGIYFLRQAPENKAVQIAPHTALRRFLRSVMFFGQDKASTSTVMDLAMAFCDRIPCYELHFLPDDSFWRCIDVQ